MGIQSRASKKREFMKENNITEYDRKIMKDDFKDFRQKKRMQKQYGEMKTGGTPWTRSSKLTNNGN